MFVSVTFLRLHCNILANPCTYVLFFLNLQLSRVVIKVNIRIDLRQTFYHSPCISLNDSDV